MGGKLPLLLCELKLGGLPPSLLTLVSVLPPTGGENIKSHKPAVGSPRGLPNPPPSTDPSLRIFTIRGLPPQIEVWPDTSSMRKWAYVRGPCHRLGSRGVSFVCQYLLSPEPHFLGLWVLL